MGSKRWCRRFFEGLQEATRKKLFHELRRSIAVDNVEVVKVGELMKCRVVNNLARPAIKKEETILTHTPVNQRRTTLADTGRPSGSL